MRIRLPALVNLGIALLLLAAPLAHAQSADKDVLKAETERCAALKGGRWTELAHAPTWVIDAKFHAATPERRAYCEIEGYVNPTDNFGMYLPADNWNGRFLVRGCGGSCGRVATEYACARHLRDGYACLHSDMGHHSDQIDNNWVANNLQGQVDFGYRATHVTTLAGKAITEAYYAEKPKHVYYFGCSTGGRQGLVEAQRFPADFDGIVTVAGVSERYGRLFADVAKVNHDENGQPILTDAKMPLIYKAVMAQCDMNDGVKDWLVDPRDCKFDPASLQCKGGDQPSCLTEAQVKAVRAMYAEGVQVGSELNWINNFARPPGPPVEFAQSRGDPDIVESFNNATDPDLREFRDHGGKMIMSHGTTDTVVPTGATWDYYDIALNAMGGLAETQKFFRYFLIPGMDHCGGGDGAWGVNYLPLIEAWVEKGQAPDKLVGIHPKMGVDLDYFGIDSDHVKREDVAFSRPYFPYPLRAYYSGKGNPNDAASFVSGLKPLGKKAPEAAGAAAADPDTLAAQIKTEMGLVEHQYEVSGLPPKNVSDRIGKALRHTLYVSNASPQVAGAALDKVSQGDLTDVQQVALKYIQEEFPPGQK
jgi:feruloyl esterase